jgi:MFS family permease
MAAESSPFSLANVRLFIAFRIFFNARFYYPVFTILFLDFGLTIEQFALLNTVWAITIVCAEVPSGALADILGRKHLIVATSLLMVMEMCLIAFVPLGNGTIIFWAFLINRVLSGLAEAMASGADEAIAYDTLAADGRADDWPKVLSLQMRLRSIGSIISLTIGALIYDSNLVNQLLTWLGTTIIVDQQTTMRFPIYLTLIMALFATITAFRMEEKSKDQKEGTITRTIAALKVTWKAGLWIARTPFALTIILIGMCYDHILRMIVTMTSQYFRQIHLPEASFGVIGSTIALLGLVIPKIAEHMIEKNSPAVNMYWVTGISLMGLFGLTGFFPYWGLLPMALIFIALMFVSFFTSHYLNQITESHQRATVLSFKGLAFNLAYGWIGFGFALLIGHQRTTVQAMHSAWPESAIENLAFTKSIGWFPWYTIICLGLVLIYCRYRLRSRIEHNKINSR